MLKILLNYLKEQKRNVIQVMGLGILIMIMSASYLGINFSNNKLLENYLDISHGVLYQDLKYIPYDGAEFDQTNRSYRDYWLSNLNYYYEKQLVDARMDKASFQINKNSNGTFNFVFYNPEDDIYVGENVYKETGRSSFNFRVTVPSGYQRTYDSNPDHTWPSLVDSYVYNENTPDGRLVVKDSKNRTNFFIRDKIALKHYNDVIMKELPDPHLYDDNVFNTQGSIFTMAMVGALFNNEDVEYTESIKVTDLLMTGKTFLFDSFHQYYNHPYLLKPGNRDNALSTLQGDGSQLALKSNILVYKSFAQANNLHLGDQYVIAGKNFKIVGFATSSVAAYMSYGFAQEGAFDRKNNTQVWMNPEGLQVVKDNMKSFTIQTKSFIRGYNPNIGSTNHPLLIENQWLYNFLQGNKGQAIKHVNNAIRNDQITIFINHYFHNSSLDLEAHESYGFMNARIRLTNDISQLFLVLIFVITVIIIFIIIFKLIDKNQKMIGILKASGYRNIELSVALVISILLPVFLFSCLGFLGGIFLGHLILLSYQSTVTLLGYGFYINYTLSAIIVFVPTPALGLISIIMTQRLLRIPALELITNNITKKGYFTPTRYFHKFFQSIIRGKLSYRNKLVLSNTFRNIGKSLLLMLVTLISGTLLYFALASGNMANNMFKNQLAGLNSNYLNFYNMSDDNKNNFFNSAGQPIYDFKTIAEIKQSPSAFNELLNDLNLWIDNPHDDTPINIDMRGNYLMGSELKKLVDIALPNIYKIPDLKQWYDNNHAMIDYLTNDDGKTAPDKIIGFGVVPYDQDHESPFLQTYSSFSYLNFNNTDCKYDPVNQSFASACLAANTPSFDRQLIGAKYNSSYFIPGFANTNGDTFNNLTPDVIEKSSYWQNTNYQYIKERILKQLKVPADQVNNVLFMPIVSSTLELRNNSMGQVYGITALGLDKQVKTIIGITYDTYSKLNLNTALVPDQWLQDTLMGRNPDGKVHSPTIFDGKFSNLPGNEFKYYLPLMSSTNDYQVDFHKIFNPDYMATKGLTTSISGLMDVNNQRDNLLVIQYTIQSLISILATFLIILSLLIMLVVTDMVVKDNLILINVLSSLGYRAGEVAYNFLAIYIPLMIVSAIGAIYIAPIFQDFLTNTLSNSFKIRIAAPTPWWHYLLIFLVSTLVYLFAFILTWKANVKSKQLMQLTK